MFGAVAGLTFGAASTAAPVPATPQGAAPAADPAATEEFFETRVRPLLSRRCGSCHGTVKPAGKLDVMKRESLLKGGTRGPAILLKRPAESLLLKVVRHAPGVPAMPPSALLPPAEVEVLRAWVQAGAPWPAAVATKDGPLWSMQPVKSPAVPRVRNAAWVRNPVDAFILQRLERERMVPAAEADRRTLIRRLTFDLIGLPPTPAEVDAFLADARPDAYERLVDRLLASPHYGERWARYWLDVARYADTNGYERDAEKPYSWRYRDYVIRSLNADKPYDRFVTEQLAGDELPGATEETRVATGFLRLGTWDDEPNDPVEYQYERLDDLVHSTGTAFLGLTIRCARCHDHKFDPIPQKDYYAIGAAFWGGYLEPADRKLAGGPPPQRLGETVLGFTDRSADAPPLKLLVNGDPRRATEVVGPGFLTSVTSLTGKVATPPQGTATTHRRLQLARWITDPRNPLTPRVLVNRIWQHHFGEGLVRTPNNFGRKGSPPTHPELLDWLAAGFAGAPSSASRPTTNQKPATRNQKPDPWSIKSLHRVIVTSATYRMASVHPRQAEYEQRDYANERWWRFNRRRLDADALRDAMLSVSAELNPAMGGRGFTPTVSREALEGLSRKGAEWQASPPAEQRRRTVYMFLKRALLMPFLTAFDFGDTTQPLEQRSTGVVAPQALALMNNAFSHEQSQALARRVTAQVGDDPRKQIDQLWRVAFGRVPTAGERASALTHLQTHVAPESTARRPAPQLPDGLAELQLWLRADRGVQLDANGRVEKWADGSGRGHHASQAAAAARPTLTADGFKFTAAAAPKGLPALRFDGLGRWLDLAGQPITAPGYTIVAVVSDRGKEGLREIFSNWRRESNIFGSLFLGTTGHGAIRFSDAFSPAGSLTAPEEPLILTASNGAAGAKVFQDRRLLAQRAEPLPARKLDAPYVIGQQGNIGGEYWNGDIAELIVFNRELAAQEREGLWDYLSARYGIDVPPTPLSPRQLALASLAHVLLNTNEFLFID